MYTYKIITDIADLDNYEQQWLHLEKSSMTPMLSYHWFRCFIESYPTLIYKIIVVTKNNETVAIAPLSIIKKGICLFNVIIGVKQLYEPTSVLYKDQGSLNALIQFLINDRTPTLLQRVPVTSELSCIQRKRFLSRSLVLFQSTASANYLDITTNWKEFYKSVRSTRRADINRKERKLIKQGDINYFEITPDQDSFESYFNQAITVESRSWKQKNASSLLSNKSLYNFFYCYCKRMSESNNLVIFLLYVNKTPVAMHIAIKDYNRLWILKLAHDLSWSKYSPGILLANHTIKWCFNNQLDGYEFLGSDERWQSTWPIKTMGYRTILLIPYSMMGFYGILQLIADKIKTVYKHVISRGNKS